MTRFNNYRFTPGNKSYLRLFLNQAFIRQYYRTFLATETNQNISNANDITQGTLCGCTIQQANLNKQGWNDPTQTENNRIANIITGTLGGRITFGNNYKPVIVNYLGGREGQPGGLPRPLRNRF